MIRNIIMIPRDLMVTAERDFAEYPGGPVVAVELLTRTALKSCIEALIGIHTERVRQRMSEGSPRVVLAESPPCVEARSLNIVSSEGLLMSVEVSMGRKEMI